MSDRAGFALPPRHHRPLPQAHSVRLSAATMIRATAFLGAGGVGAPAAAVIANSLRELDRFLSVLIDAVARDARPAGLDHRAFERQRNTPNKLRLIHATLGMPSPDQDRLRAIGRTRERLFHDARAARAGRRAGGDPMPPADLGAICRLYRRIADELVAGCGKRPATLTS